MKISRIKIKNVQQFKDFELDLTYPKGHDKEGQPLDKICVIGQSGTGKTTLLNLLKELSSINISSTGYRMETPYAYVKNSLIQADYVFGDLKYSFIASNIDIEDFAFFEKRPIVVQKNFSYKGNLLESAPLQLLGELHELDKALYNQMFNGKVNLMNFPLGFRYRGKRLDEYSPSPLNLDYGKISIWELWDEMVDALELQKNELTARVLDALNAQNGEREKKMAVVDKWRKENPNMLTQIGEECLNRVVEKFHLKVHDDLSDNEVLNGFRFIPLKHIQTGVLIPYPLLNSGSNVVTLIATALFFYKPEDAIVFIDEVENSLYPDVQTEIVKDYISIAPSNQFFFATHSPMVASTFEPWEIIELKFDEQGNIYQDNYLKDIQKGRQIDNYKFDPKMMSWSSILARIYDLQKDGPDQRQKELLRLATMDEKIKSKKKKGEIVSREEFDEYIKLGEALDWEK